MIAAVDIGGTKTLVAVFDNSGNIKEKQKFPTNPDYNKFKHELAEVVAKLSTSDFSRGVVGMPGRVNREEGISIRGGPNLPWTNSPICHDFEKIFKCPFRLENDAKLAGVSEGSLLKGKYSKVFYLTVSTGIGGAYVVDGALDPSLVDAEPGHMMLEHKGEYRKWEDFASGKAIVAAYGKKASEITDKEAWDTIGRNLAEGIINIIATLTPDAIVIGGGVGSHFAKFEPYLIKALSSFNNPLLSKPAILQAQHPEEAVIYGCYEYAKQH